MLADARSQALIANFAEQWLHLRNLKSSAPDLEAFPDFDDNLRQAMKEETSLFFDSIVREDRSVVDLLNADYTFVNERLARHYGIPDIYGSQFRRVKVTSEARRGLLGQASLLTVTSYPNRTSPVERGKWMLTNLLGVPPQPPPPNVPSLDTTIDRRQGALAARAHGEAPRESHVRRLSQSDGSDWLRARELSTASAAGERRRTGRQSTRRARSSTAPSHRRRRRAPPEYRRAPGDLRRRDDREDVDLRARTRPRVLRHAGRAQDRPRREDEGLPFFIHRAGCRTEHAVPVERS